MYGLLQQDLDTLYDALRRFPNIEQAILFGSRAKGNFRPGSDVDIALKGKDLSQTVLQLSTYLNQETLLPYQFDIIDYTSIDNQDLIEHIDRVGIVLFNS